MGKSQRHSEGDCHSNGILSEMPCFCGDVSLLLRPSPAWGAEMGTAGDQAGWKASAAHPWGAVPASGPARRSRSSPSQSISRQSAKGREAASLGARALLIYPRSSEQPVSAPAQSAFGPAAGWFLWLLSSLH